MFGLIYTGIVLVCKAALGIHDGITSTKSLNKAIENNRVTYRSANGCEKYVATGEAVYHDRLINGERVLKNNKGEVVHNFDRLNRLEEIRKDQEEIDKETDGQLVLLGSFGDCFPELVRKSGTKWNNVGVRCAVYQYLPDKQFYFRKRYFSPTMPKYEYINVLTGEATHLYQDPTENSKKHFARDTEFIQNYNLIIDDGFSICL